MTLAPSRPVKSNTRARPKVSSGSQLTALTTRTPSSSHDAHGPPIVRRVRLPDTAHTSRPWRIHELAPDFRLEDVWALPTPGGPDDFPRLVRLGATDDPRTLNAQGKYVGDGSRGIVSRVSRALFELRWKLGELLGWDDRDSGVGRRVATLRDRL